MATFFKLFFAFVVSFNVILFLGFIIRRKISNCSPSWKEFFYSLTVGWFTVSFLIALLYTKLHTALIIPLILFVGYWFAYELPKTKPSRLNKTERIKLEQILVLNLIAILFFTTNWLLICGFNFEKVYYPTADMAYYTRLSDFLVNTGTETGTLDYFFPADRKTFPYHYIEHWFTGGVSKIFNLKTAHLYTLVYIPLLIVTLYTGFISLFQKSNTKFRYEYLLAFLALFVSGFAFIYPNYIDVLHVYIHDWSVLKYFKLLPVYLIILCAIFEFERQNYQFAIVLIAFSGLVYGTTLPAAFTISGGLIVLFFLSSFRKKKSIPKNIIPPIIFIIVGMILFGYNYIFHNQEAENNAHFAPLTTIDYSHYMRTGLNIFVKISFAIIVVLLPYTLLTIYWAKKESMTLYPALRKFKPYYLMLLASILSVVAYALIHSIPNAHQLYRSMYFVCGNLGAVWLISAAYKSQYKQVQILSVMFIIINTIIHFEYRPINEAKFIDKEQFSSVENYLSDQNGKIIYFRYLPDNKRYYSAETEVYIPSNYLQLIFSPLQIACANPEVVLSEPISDFREALLSHVDASPFNRLHRELYGSNIYEEKNDLIYIDFIEKFEINGVIAPDGFELPLSIHGKILNSINLMDGNIYYKIH